MSDSTWPRGVSAPAARALAAAGYHSVEQLAGVSASELLALHGMGPKAIGVLREALRDRGLDFS
ncbi:hypothetical protein GPX89_37455 [Nocardia sp. ET3-3]|uniref:DNA-binding protein n=1 Tax=Nocardia terrae TaxID=2675851 RepID=A0A7K1V8U8_9NOCA|nr:helix-hairpin-helix domain-containing protein [Nocardia terrae]MVU82911.1 hypothetical protein [Nocardia terrae]